MAQQRRPAGGKSAKYPKPSNRRPQRRRRSMFSRAARQRTVIALLAAGLIAGAGAAVAGAIGGGGSSNTAADTVTPAASVSPTGPAAPRITPQATPSPHPSAVRTHHATPVATPVAVVTPPVKATATPSSSPCPSSSTARVAEARALLQHQSALPPVTVLAQGARPGLLGAADAGARTVTLYVRSCAEEPTIQLAVVWGYEAGQFIPTERWDSSTRARWRQLRGTSALVSDAQLKQDAASAYAYWQTGSTRYWQSPVPPPSFNQLSQLVPFFTFS